MWPLVVLAAWAVVLLFNRRLIRSIHQSGDASHGIIVFVEPVRWLFYIWGFTEVCAGLRWAGCRQKFLLFRWSSPLGSVFVLPDLMRRTWLLHRAERLATYVEELSQAHPQTPIHLIGYSTGCFVLLESLTRLQEPLQIGSVVLLAGTASPGYDLTQVARRVGRLHSFHSWLDCAINGVGPVLFGCNDRRWAPAFGMVGFSKPLPPNVSQSAWTPADLRLGYLGGHFTVASPLFAAERIAPLFAERLS